MELLKLFVLVFSDVRITVKTDLKIKYYNYE